MFDKNFMGSLPKMSNCKKKKYKRGRGLTPKLKISKLTKIFSDSHIWHF